MAYGTIKVNNITFDDGGSDQTVTVSGLYNAFTNDIAVTGTISGTTVTGTTANFVSGVFTTQISGTTVTGTTSSFTTGNFTTLSGATATFTSGVIASGTATNPSLSFVGDPNTGIFSPGADQVAVATNGAGRLFVDASGRVLVGSSSAVTFPNTFVPPLQVNGSAGLSFGMSRWSANANAPVLILSKSRGASIGTRDLVTVNDELGLIQFSGDDGTNFLNGAAIGAFVDGTPGTNDMPSRLVFYTTADNLPSPSERLRITSAGLVGIGTSSPGAGLHIVSTGQTTANLDTSANINTIISDNGSAVGNGGSLVFAAASGTWRFAAIKGLVTSGTSNTTGNLTFSTRNANTDATLTERLRITSTGNVGIGTTSPGALLAVSASDSSALGASILLSNPQSDANLQITAAGTSFSQAGWPVITDAALIRSSAGASGGLGLIAGAASSPITFFQADQERARIDSSGRLLVGTSSAPPAVETLTPGFALSSSGSAQDGYTAGIYCYRNAGGSGRQTVGPKLFFGRSRSGTNGSTGTVVIDGENIGDIRFAGDDGSKFVTAAEIRAFVDGTPGADDMPGRLVFSTTAAGASSPTERMRIGNDGKVLFNKTALTITTAGVQINSAGELGATVDASNCFFVNRLTDDGDLIRFIQGNTTEGTISVSGTTVSYNGAHLSRWSQLIGLDPYNKEERPEILRGTVMSNLDEMCDWTCPESGECQDNEQLNKTKISDVEGDKNVAGIFQSWDDDDDTWVNDFYLAMTGDFVIRIAAGTTVERGDLLMSAGDGTAKPQADDLVRSCTVAKVTSTNVSCTYDDGSYCVPCVLMAS
jgi:hypothetical protein